MRLGNQIFLIISGLLLGCCTAPSEAANILCLVGTSHHNNPGWTQTLFSALAERGHTLTVISTAPMQRQSGITHIPIADNYDVVQKHYVDKQTGLYKKLWSEQQVLIWYETLLGSCRALMESNVLHSRNGHMMQELRKSYDLIIYDGTYGLDCLLNLIPLYKTVPVLGVSSGKLTSDLLAVMAAEDTLNAASVPHFLSELNQNLNYWGRLRNHFMYICEVFVYWSVVKPVLTNMLSTSNFYVPVEVMLLNTHPVLDYVQNMPPNIVEVGGLHIRDEAAALPSTIEHFIDEHPEGIIYISLPYMELLRDAAIEAILNLVHQHNKCGFIWNVPKNGKDLPVKTYPNLLVIKINNNKQQDILAQGNIKAFITHGDSFSLQEAVYNAIPVIVLPLILEQMNNAKRVQERSLGITINPSNLTFSLALNELLGNPIYSDSLEAAQLSFRRRIVSPLDQAVWYAEQLISNPQLFRHLALSPNSHQSYIARHSLDVLMLPLLFLLIFIFNLCFVIYEMIDAFKLMKARKNKKSEREQRIKDNLKAAKKSKDEKEKGKAQRKAKAQKEE